MLKSAAESALQFLALLVGGLTLGLSVGVLGSVWGVPGPTFALAESPAQAAMVVAALLVPVVVIAIVVGRVLNPARGLFVVGASLAVLSMQCGTIEDFAFAGGSLSSMALETLIWAGVVALIAVVVISAAGGLPEVPPSPRGMVADLIGPGLLLFLAAGLVAVPVIWLLETTPLKGQAIGATLLASITVGVLGRVLAPRSQPALLFCVPLLAGAAGAAFAARGLEGSIADRFVDGSLSRLAYPMPLDWAAGALCGVSIGLGWSRSFLRSDAEEEIQMRRAVQG